RLRTAPSCPLFPYTTLFRSLLFRAGEHDAMLRQMQPRAVTRHALPGQQLIDQRREHLPRQIRGRQPAQAPAFEAEHARVPEVLGDRKSTRLNSSHQIISYAV